MMKKKSDSGRIDVPQMVLIGLVIFVIGLFLANSTFLAIGTGVTPPRRVADFCYDSDGGKHPYTAGTVVVVSLDQSIQTRLSNRELVNYVTSINGVSHDQLPVTFPITFQPPGVTGSGISGTITIDIDTGSEAISADEIYDPENSSSPPDTQDQQAVLNERYCLGDRFIQTQVFIGKELSSSPDPLLRLLTSLGSTVGGNPVELV